mmetsp:Transcript_45639/g.76197  ORF Transcript_45639/g.76197 Transcript_45639/m.76197 type:complete len:564 (-) Transcript_45639:365-2056(-)
MISDNEDFIDLNEDPDNPTREEETHREAIQACPTEKLPGIDDETAVSHLPLPRSPICNESPELIKRDTSSHSVTAEDDSLRLAKHSPSELEDEVLDSGTITDSLDSATGRVALCTDSPACTDSLAPPHKSVVPSNDGEPSRQDLEKEEKNPQLLVDMLNILLHQRKERERARLEMISSGVALPKCPNGTVGVNCKKQPEKDCKRTLMADCHLPSAALVSSPPVSPKYEHDVSEFTSSSHHSSAKSVQGNLPLSKTSALFSDASMSSCEQSPSLSHTGLTLKSSEPDLNHSGPKSSSNPCALQLQPIYCTTIVGKSVILPPLDVFLLAESSLAQNKQTTKQAQNSTDDVVQQKRRFAMGQKTSSSSSTICRTVPPGSTITLPSQSAVIALPLGATVQVPQPLHIGPQPFTQRPSRSPSVSGSSSCNYPSSSSSLPSPLGCSSQAASDNSTKLKRKFGPESLFSNINTSGNIAPAIQPNMSQTNMQPRVVYDRPIRVPATARSALLQQFPATAASMNALALAPEMANSIPFYPSHLQAHPPQPLQFIPTQFGLPAHHIGMNSWRG